MTESKKLKKCGPEDWEKWANGLCDSSVKTKDFTKLQDWSWNQMDGFKGQDRIISKVPVVFMAQTYDGKIKSKSLQLIKNTVTLKRFAKKLETLFHKQKGDQSLIGIKNLEPKRKF